MTEILAGKRWSALAIPSAALLLTTVDVIVLNAAMPRPTAGL